MQIYVPLSQLDDNPFQARQEYGDVAELAADIIRHKSSRQDTLGLQQVPTGRLVGDDGLLVPIDGLELSEWLDGSVLRRGWRVQLEFGHRRRRAFQHLRDNGAREYGRMPVIIRDLTDEQMLDGVWQENRSRRDLSAVEEAELMQQKLARVSSQRELAEAWGLARPTVANRLALLQLPPEVKAANREGKLPARTAADLINVAKIQTAVNGQDWESIGSHWHKPTPPDEYIAKVLASPDDVKSDDVRDYVRRALNHAGRPLHKAVADYPTSAGGVVQMTCSGCSYRLNQTCLNHDGCLEIKQHAFIDSALQAAAELLNVEISDDDADFVEPKHDRNARKLWEEAFNQREKHTAVQFVVGWRVGVEWNGVRPFFHDGIWVSEDQAFEGDGRSGIVIGIRGGRLPDWVAEVVAPNVEGLQPKDDDRPPVDLRQEWEKAAVKLSKAWQTRAEHALVEAISWRMDDVIMDLVQALVPDPDKEWEDNPDKVAAMLVGLLYAHGRGIRNHYHAVEKRQTIEAALRRFGRIEPAEALSSGTKAGDLEEQAVALLGWWWSKYWREPDDCDMADRLREHLLAHWPADAGDDLNNLRNELDRLARDVARERAKRLAKEKELAGDNESAFEPEYRPLILNSDEEE